MINGSLRSIAFTLRAKVLLAFVVVALVPLAILARFNYVTSKQALTNKANTTLLAAASQTAVRLDAAINANLLAISTRAQLPAIADYLSAYPARQVTATAKKQVLDIMRIFSGNNAVFISSYALLDLRGRNVIDSDDWAIIGDESARDYFQVALETGLPYVSSVEFEPGDGKAFLFFSSPVLSATTGKPLGVLRVRYSAAILQQWIVQDSGLTGSQSYPILLDRNGLILADGCASPGSASSLTYQLAAPLSPERLAELTAARRLPPQPDKALPAQASGLAESLARVDSLEPYFTVQRYSAGTGPEAAAVMRIKTIPWLVAFLTPQEALLAPARAQARNSVALVAIIVLIVAIIAISAVRLLTNPIVRLTDVVRHVAGGNLDARAEIESNDEIGVLAQAFNSMTDQLRVSIDSLEQRVADRTAQLEAAIYDLENFNYSASHDLRIPLRAIDGFSKIILDEYSAELDAEGIRLLNVVRENTDKLAQYIDDMQAFSRAGRMTMVPAEIDMEELVRDVMEELKPAETRRDIRLEIDSLPTVYADRPMLRWVFVNLLSNAFKFSRNQATPHIKVGATIKANETICFVQDNGVGFDMRYADKLFGVFERLHSVDEHEGTGIGLAIVKRIVSRHGGRVWAEGRINEGATFYFALPTKGLLQVEAQRT